MLQTSIMDCFPFCSKKLQRLQSFPGKMPSHDFFEGVGCVGAFYAFYVCVVETAKRQHPCGLQYLRGKRCSTGNTTGGGALRSSGQKFPRKIRNIQKTHLILDKPFRSCAAKIRSRGRARVYLPRGLVHERIYRNLCYFPRRIYRRQGWRACSTSRLTLRRTIWRLPCPP